MTEKDCIFCKIIKGEIPSEKIYEDEWSLAFLDINPVNAGHALVVPKDHFENIYTTPDETLARLSLVVKKVAVAIKNGMGADGVTISMNNEPAGGQVIFHTHFHIVPRLETDGLKLWPQRKYQEGELSDTLEKIREALKD
ncbi:MAG: HIT family protein [Candidatus Paceibacterota bacterium]